MNFKALCFVDMPFGQKPDLKSGVVVDFDQIYNDAIKPAIEDCGLESSAVGAHGGFSFAVQLSARHQRKFARSL